MIPIDSQHNVCVVIILDKGMGGLIHSEDTWSQYEYYNNALYENDKGSLGMQDLQIGVKTLLLELLTRFC